MVKCSRTLTRSGKRKAKDLFPLIEINHMKPTFVDDNICLDTEVNNLWARLGKENSWPVRTRLNFSTKCTILRLHGQFKTNLETLYPQFPVPKMMDILEKIARERWNWSKSPAPMNLLGAEASWSNMEHFYLEHNRRRQVETHQRLEHLQAWADDLLKRNHTPDAIVRMASLQQRDKDFTPEEFEFWKKKMLNK